jgi:hypothetical protein
MTSAHIGIIFLVCLLYICHVLPNISSVSLYSYILICSCNTSQIGILSRGDRILSGAIEFLRAIEFLSGNRILSGEILSGNIVGVVILMRLGTMTSEMLTSHM